MASRLHALRRGAYTVVELALVLGILGVLAATAVAGFSGYRERMRRAQVIVHMKAIETALQGHDISGGGLPETLEELDPEFAGLKDPWGHPYRYTPVPGTPIGKLRKDKFLVPINSDYDLYSMGPDGDSESPLQAKPSRDDIIRAGDGSYYGPADRY